jgi:LysR family glycine cleavage system transcriptional activator
MAHDTIAGQLIETGRLRPLFDHRMKMQEAYYLIAAPHLSDIPGGAEFVAWLREEITNQAMRHAPS